MKSLTRVFYSSNWFQLFQFFNCNHFTDWRLEQVIGNRYLPHNDSIG